MQVIKNRIFLEKIIPEEKLKEHKELLVKHLSRNKLFNYKKKI